MNARDYNNEIVSLQQKLYKAIDSLEDNLNIDKIDLLVIDHAYENLKSVSHRVLTQINNITPYQGGEEFYDSAKDLFSTIDALSKKEYPILIKYLNKPVDTWTDAVFNNYYDTWDKIENKIMKKEDKFFAQQQKFADQNNLELQ